MAPGVDGWEVSLKGMMGIVVLLGLVISSIYWGVNKLVLNLGIHCSTFHVSAYGFIGITFH